MQMHIPTMFLMVIAVSLTMASCTAALWKREQPEGLGYWTVGLLSHAAAFLLFSLRDSLPFSLTVVLANLMLVAAFSLFCEAMLQFQHRRMPRTQIWWPVLVAGPALWVLPDAVKMRITIVSVLCVYQLALLLLITFRCRRETPGRGQYLVMLATLMGITTMSCRTIGTALGNEQILQLTSSTPIQVITFLTSSIALMLTSTGLVLMTKERADARSQSLALHDELTGLPNRRYSLEILSRLHANLHRSLQPFSVLVLDIDHFKQVNDQYGHPTGDRVLQRLAHTLHTHLRATDHAGRLGGEEFLVLLPNTNASGAARLAEKLRHSVEQLQPDSPEMPLRITVSIGVYTVLPGNQSDPLEAVALADKALYHAKQNGRNRVETASIDSAPVPSPLSSIPS